MALQAQETAQPSRKFPNYLEQRTRISLRTWHVLRFFSIIGALGLAAVLIIEPKTGLDIFWKAVVPILPLVWLAAPGLWRNICPLAATNQTPIYLKFTRALTPPAWFTRHAPVIALTLLVVTVSSRKPLFNGSGLSTSLLIICALIGALAGGILFKGKSGWCTSICPLFPVQQIYGQTPIANVPNSHCRPCVGCVKNCYDFNPRASYLADIYDRDKLNSLYRRLFAGMFPGLVLAYFALPSPDSVGTVGYYALFALALAASTALYFSTERLKKFTPTQVTATFAAVGLVAFYWFASETLADTITGDSATFWIIWPLRLLVLGLTAVWLDRTWKKEKDFVDQSTRPLTAGFGEGAAAALRKLRANLPVVTFADSGIRVSTPIGKTLLELAENADQPIEWGCRLGLCGADPIRIVSGQENLSATDSNEEMTLKRLGVAPNTRMACCARVHGSVDVSLDIETVPPAPRSIGTSTLGRIVVIGVGIAGVTTADHIRRLNPDVEIHMLSDEPYLFYNRIGICRLLHGGSTIENLKLLPDRWYKENRIKYHLDAQVKAIDPEKNEVILTKGKPLQYERLVLAQGAAPRIPEQFTNFGIPGTFMLRTADDAISMREYIKDKKAEEAVIAGGGLLSLEAAYALRKKGLHVTVLERSDRLMSRQVDQRAAEMVRTYMKNIGIDTITKTQATEIVGDESGIKAVKITGDKTLKADVLMVAAGIIPRTDLAKEAGLEVGMGLKVNSRLQTSNPDIYAVGDLIEYNERVLSLWPAAIDQAEIAAENIVGGDRTYEGTIPVTGLKVLGISLTSCGQITFDPEKGEEEIVFEESDNLVYRRLIVRDGRQIVGAILLGQPQYNNAVTKAVTMQRDISEQIDDLRAGNWQFLEA